MATNWNAIYWNTACLIVNSGSTETEDDFEELETEEKKKEKATDYAKIAKALGDILSRGIKVSLIDINKSDITFKPDIEKNEILFGMKALSGINTDTVELIKKGRPYKSFKDFLARCPLKKTAIISLIKAGAFDNLEKELAKELKIEPRILIMAYYISKACEPKNKLNLQNFNGLLNSNLVPEDLNFQKRVYHFNKYLKNCKASKYYLLDEVAYNFYSKYFEVEDLEIIQGYTCINQKEWDKKYKKTMDAARVWLKDNQENILKQYNTLLFNDCWNKYATGTISYWEMEALCFYYHPHELTNVNNRKYGITNFFSLSSNPNVDYYYPKNGKNIPIYKIHRIAGTVISKNDARSSISLLTVDGVVNVKFTKEYYAMFSRQISEKNEDGTKSVKEKSWFTRGTKLLISGFRRDDMFIAKTYKNTNSHQLYKITNVYKDGTIEITHDRYEPNNNT